MQPTPPWHIATKRKKERKKEKTLDMDGKFYPIFFFLVGGGGTRGENGEFSKGKSGRGMGKSEKNV